MEIAVYGFHDSSVCVKDDGQYFIYEFERFAGERYAVLTDCYPHAKPPEELVRAFYEHIFSRHPREYKVCHINQFFAGDRNLISEYAKIQEFVGYDHHYAHAASAYRQSQFSSCHIITYDGDGINNDGSYSSFVAWKADGDKIQKVKDFQPYSSHSLGNAYLCLTGCLSSIKKRPTTPEKYRYQGGNSGKLMGLASYGSPRDEWKPAFQRFFDSATIDGLDHLESSLKFDITTPDILSGQLEYDFAATIQWAFEDKFFRIFSTLEIPHGANICLGGGCALNILVNQKLHDLGYKVFVPPNAADCGLTFGVLADRYGDRGVDITYRGFDILDHGLVDPSCSSKEVDVAGLAKQLYQDKRILGYISGKSECGPRALGNRSILCYPTLPHLKERLNAEVKFREWYRPFGAITKLETLGRYFFNGCESPYMNFCPTLRPQYRFPSISHVDNTCRIQTVTRSQNQGMYDLLTEIENLGGEPILLNTSFNIKGKPILTRLADAFETLRDTKLEGFYYDGKIYERKRNVKF